MNLVDSCGWLEYLAGGPNAGFFQKALEDQHNLIVPSICLHEVFKKIYQSQGKESAVAVLAIMQQSTVIDLDARLAVESAVTGTRLKLSMADSMIYTIARNFQASLYTQDAHFENLPGVCYIRK